jgi:hypothetical protein
MTTVRVVWEIDVESEELPDVNERSTPAEIADAAISYVYDTFYGDMQLSTFAAHVNGQKFEMDLDTNDGPKLIEEKEG